MSWENSIKEFKYYLRVERSLTNNTVDAYIRDVNKLSKYSINNNLSIKLIIREPYPQIITTQHES